jgi:hypothetical protein
LDEEQRPKPKKQWRLLCRDGEILSLYDDGLDLSKVGETTVVRNSHVNPIKKPSWWDWLTLYWTQSGRDYLNQCSGLLTYNPRPYFGIFWVGRCRKMFGYCTMFDGDDNAFKTHGDAVKYEIEMLDMYLNEL